MPLLVRIQRNAFFAEEENLVVETAAESKKAKCALLDLQPCENVGWKATAIHYHQKLFVIEWAH